MNFPYQRKRTLEEQFKKYIPWEKYHECIEKHRKYAVNEYNEYLKNRSIERKRMEVDEKE